MENIPEASESFAKLASALDADAEPLSEHDFDLFRGVYRHMYGESLPSPPPQPSHGLANIPTPKPVPAPQNPLPAAPSNGTVHPHDDKGRQKKIDDGRSLKSRAVKKRLRRGY